MIPPRTKSSALVWAAVAVSLGTIGVQSEAKRQRGPSRIYGELLDDTWPTPRAVLVLRDTQRRMRHVRLKPSMRVLMEGEQTPRDNWPYALASWRGAMPERYPDVCVDVQPDGSAKTVNIFAANEAGILLKATQERLLIQTDPQRGAGIGREYEVMNFAFPNPWQGHPPPGSQQQFIRLSKRTRFSFNLDPVPPSRILHQPGLFIFVLNDRFGAAKYVDAIRVNLLWHLRTDDSIEVVRLPRGKQQGSLVHTQVTAADSMSAGRITRTRYQVASTVKVYDGVRRTSLTKMATFRYGFAHIALEPKKRWITHVFITPERE